MKTRAPILIAPAANALWHTPPAEEAGTVKLLAIAAPFPPNGEEEALLQNILAATGLPRGQIVTQTATPTEVPLWLHLRTAFRPGVLLLLGITPAQMGIQAQFPPILPQNFDEAIWIAGPALQVLQANRNLRSALWTEGLKPCFAP